MYPSSCYPFPSFLRRNILLWMHHVTMSTLRGIMAPTFAIGPPMRKFALIAIREATLRYCEFSLICTTVGRYVRVFTWRTFVIRARSRIRQASAARYHEDGRWKAKQLSFICRIARRRCNVGASSCIKDPLNPITLNIRKLRKP